MGMAADDVNHVDDDDTDSRKHKRKSTRKAAAVRAARHSVDALLLPAKQQDEARIRALKPLTRTSRLAHVWDQWRAYRAMDRKYGPSGGWQRNPNTHRLRSSIGKEVERRVRGDGARLNVVLAEMERERAGMTIGAYALSLYPSSPVVSSPPSIAWPFGKFSTIQDVVRLFEVDGLNNVCNLTPSGRTIKRNAKTMYGAWIGMGDSALVRDAEWKRRFTDEVTGMIQSRTRIVKQIRSQNKI